MKKIVLVFGIFLSLQISFAQNSIGIGTASPNASAVLDVSSASKGVLLPRINLTSTIDPVTIPSPANGLLVFNTNAGMSAGTGFIIMPDQQ
ncbi:MAG: hypothetical protein V4722_08885 [Bacteroidota bacterium]